MEDDLPVPCEELRFTRHGLEVVERKYGGFSQVVIYDENEKMTLTSDNPGLWEAMLDVWHELRARREAGLRETPSAAQSAAIEAAAAWLDIVDRAGYEVACSAGNVAERFDVASCRASLASLYETERVLSRRVSSAAVMPAGLGGNANRRALVVFASSLETGETEENIIVDLADSPGIIGYSTR